MNSPLQISPKELLSRYQAGERNFAGIRLASTDDDSEALCGADLSEIILSGAYLPGVKLREVNLSGSLMVGVYLPDADLTLADLSCANLSGATLKRACLECADLNKTLLEGANLIGANLDGADIRQTFLDFSVLCQTNWSKIWPYDGFDYIYCPQALLWETTMPDGTLISNPQYDPRYAD